MEHGFLLQGFRKIWETRRASQLLPKKRSAHFCLFSVCFKCLCTAPPLKQGWGSGGWPQMAKQKWEESARQQPFLLGMDTSGIFSAKPSKFYRTGHSRLKSPWQSKEGCSWSFLGYSEVCFMCVWGGGCFVQKMGRGSEVYLCGRWGCVQNFPP